MGLFDVHAHLTHPKLYPELEQVLSAARRAGLTSIISNGLNPEDNEKVRALAAREPLVKPAFGLYPVDAVLPEMRAAGIDYPREVEHEASAEEAIAWVADHVHEAFAVGEIGLDGYWVPEPFWEAQERAFRALVEIAMRADKAIIIHTRKRERRTLEILREMGAKRVDWHCFGGKLKLAREIAEDFFGDRNHIQFRALTASQRVEAIRSGQVDMVVRMTTMTCERWQEMAFSTEYLTAGQSVLVPAGSPVESIDDLRGERVCAALGSTSLSVLVEHPAGLIAVGAPSAVDCLVMLQQGQVAAVSTDNTILAGFVAQDPQVRVVGEPFTDEPYGIAMAPDAEDLVRYVNGVLERLRADGTWARLYDRWLAPHLGPAAPPQPRYRD